MSFPKITGRERLFIAITVSRLGLTYGFVQSVGGPFRWSALWLTAIIIADVPNGVAARRFDADSPYRRIADSVVDVSTIIAACLAMAMSRSGIAVALLPLALRGLFAIVAAVVCFTMKRTIVTGGQLHKIDSLSLGAMGFMILAHTPYTTLAIGAATIISWIFFLDYVPVYRTVLNGQRAPAILRYKTRF